MLAIFNSLGGGEVIAILVIGLIVLGPEKLPDAIRKFGNIYGELRRMSQGFQSELRDVFDEPMQSIRGTAQMMQDAVNQPLQSITERTAPVVGGGQKAEPDEEAQAPVDDTPAAGEPVPEVSGSVDDDEAPAGSAAAAWVGEQANSTGVPPETTAGEAARAEEADGVEPNRAESNGVETNGVGVNAAVEAPAGATMAQGDGEDEEPVLAEAGLLVSEPEMPTEVSEDEERPA